MRILNVKVVLFILIAGFLISGCKKQEGSLDGTVFSFIGSVTVNGVDAKKDMPVKFGDIVKTGSNSGCKIKIGNKNIIMLSEKAELKYSVKKGSGLFSLTSGRIGAILKDKSGAGQYQIKTPTIVASVRGTTLYVAVENPKQTYACICNGITTYKTADNKKEQEHAAAHHKAFTFAQAGDKTVRKDAGMKYHSDKAMESLAQAIKAKIDWTKIDN